MDELGEQVARAVHVLNHDSESCNRVAANQWLVSFQNSESAWRVSTSLLTSAPPDFDLHFFAAQILRRKIKNNGYYLQPPDKDALLDSLLIAAVRFSLGPPQLLTQTCLAISALMLRTTAGEHEKPISQLFSSFDKLQSQANGNLAVLELLTVLPEEILDDQNGDLCVDSRSRCRFKRELLSHTPNVLEFLILQAEQRLDNGIQLQQKNCKVLRCLSSWAKVGCFSEIPSALLPTHPLLNFVFTSLQVPSSFAVAIEVLTEIVNRNEGLPQVFLLRVQYIREILLQPALANRDEKVIGGLACLMSEIGQAAPSLIAEATKESLLLADSILSCITFPSEDWEISDSTLQFWCSLATYLLGLDMDKAVNKEKFYPIFTALLDALLSRAQVDDSYIDSGTGTVDIPDGFAHFRMNMEEVLVDTCQLLGPASFVRKLFSGGWASTDLQIPWMEVEARMFMLNMVAESVLQSGRPFDFLAIKRLVVILLSKRPEELKGVMSFVYKCVAEVVGSYSKWLSSSPSDMRSFLLFCATGITESISSSSCSSTLRKLCEDASTVVLESQNLEILIWIGESLEKKKLPLNEEEEIVTAISLIISSISNKELRKSSLARLLASSYGAIDKLVDANNDNYLKENPSAYTQALNSAVRGLHRMGSVFKNFGSSHATSQVQDETILVVLGMFWPLLEKLLSSRHMENESLSAASCRCLSQAIHHSGEQFLMLLPKVLDYLSKNFLQYQGHDCFIRTAAVAIEEFGHKQEYGPSCISTFEKFTTAASITSLKSSYICDQEPDLVEAYTNFTSTFVRCCSKEILAASGTLLELSLQKAAVCCTAMHRGAALAAMSYMSCFLEVSLITLLESISYIREESFGAVAIQVLSRSGEGLISNLLYALLGVSALSRVHKSATILQQLAAICSLTEGSTWKSVLCWDSLCRWLQSTIQKLPSEYLKEGEAEALVPLWLNALVSAASDYLQSRAFGNSRFDNGHMQGKGGRTLKRIIRDFAESHRNTPNPS